MSGFSGFQPAKARLRRQGSRRDSEYRRQYLQRTGRRRNGPDALRTIRKDRAETTIRKHQPQRYLDVDKHPARQSYSCVENLDALAENVFVGAVSDNFGEEIEQKIFHARIVVDNEAVKKKWRSTSPYPKYRRSSTPAGETSCRKRSRRITAASSRMRSTSSKLK